MSKDVTLKIIVDAQSGCGIAMSTIWEAAIPQVNRVTALFVRKYPWIDHEDLSQSVLCAIPKFVRQYKSDRGTAWNKYLYFKIYRESQDTLRREDPLGVKIPQKKHYPSWRRFSELTDSSDLTDSIVNRGIEYIDSGTPMNWDENIEITQNYTEPEHQDRQYHGRLENS